jgi:hypothetical protein
MRIVRLGLLPVPVIYTERIPHPLGGGHAGGRGAVPWYAPVVLLHPSSRGDEGALQHELEHVRQWWTAYFMAGGVLVLNACVLRPLLGEHFWQATFIGLWLSWVAHPLLYLGSRTYRLWCELCAYKAQLRYPGLSLSAAAEMLASPRYRLDIDFKEARRRLAGD